jgi:transposase
MNNKCIYRSIISEAKFKSLLKCFSLDMEASKISALTRISRNTINRALRAIRKRISEFRELESPFDQGEVEIDESYFWAGRGGGVRGRGAGGKTVVFGLIKHKGKVYAQVVKNCSVKELVPIIRKRVGIDSVIYTDGLKTYNGPVNFGYKKDYRIHHGKN